MKDVSGFIQDIEFEREEIKTKTTKRKKKMSENETAINPLEAIDFNLEEDVTPLPLILKGDYPGSITEAKLNNKLGAIVITVTFNGTNSLMNDGETPVEGASASKRIWLPKPGDEAKATKGGQNLKMWKMRQLMRDLRTIGRSENTPAEILEMLVNQELIGLDVIATVGINTYKGETSNEVEKMVLDIEDPTV